MPGWIETAKRADRVVFKRFRDHFTVELVKALSDCNSVLDVGCGASSPLERLPRRIPHTVGVDLFEPWLGKSKARGIHDDYVVADVLKLDEHFAPRSFDGVLAADLFEHLDKEDGYRLLRLMEQIARKKVVIFTPNGFIEQHVSDGNPLQVHRSGWNAQEMRDLGFDVVGINGWRPLRGEYARPRWRPKIFWYRMSLLSQPLVSSRPAHAFAILCAKAIPQGVEQPKSAAHFAH